MRYFILEGELRERYAELEEKEMSELQRQAEVMSENGVKNYRVGRDGSIASLIFEEGRKPADVSFVRARKDFPKEEVRPHGKAKDAKKWRDLLKDVQVKTHASETMCSELKLPMFVFTRPSVSQFGSMVMSGSRIARVGPEIVAAVPTPYKDSEGDNLEGKFQPSPGLREIKVWEFEKLKDDHKDYKHEHRAIVMV